MDLVLKARRARISPHDRERIERKLVRLSRFQPRIQRVEVEVIAEASRRVNGGQRVEVSCRAPRRTFRATGTGSDLDAAVDQVVERLERQLTADHGRRRARLIGGANRVKSGAFPVGRAGRASDED